MCIRDRCLAFSDPTFLEQDPNNDWRVAIAKLVLRFSRSVRVGSDDLLKYIEGKYRRLRGKVKLLPFYFDLAQIRDREPQFSSKNDTRSSPFLFSPPHP